jgi:Uma2 family endonuclease
MSDTTPISASEYLSTSYHPDCDYIDGELIERNSGELDHSMLQTAILVWFGSRQHEWNILSVVAPRVQVSEKRFRIPDVSVISRDQPMEPIVRVPPIVCCEVLSRSDTMRSLRDRANDYLKFGVQHVWAFDPVLREAFVCDVRGFHAPDGEQLGVPGTPIFLPLRQIFAELD